MEKIILILALLFTNLIFSQNNYDEGMAQALELWQNDRPAEASDLFERIAIAEQEEWIPNYYVALVNTTRAFQNLDNKNVEDLVAKAQEALDKELNKDPENPELLVVQALIYTALIANDPMNNGQKLSGKVIQIYEQAEKIDPTNPRVILSKAQFEMGSAKYFGTDTQPICDRIEKSLTLFDTFKSEIAFYPKWGKEQAEQAISQCGK
ncbi:hypothetical protein L1I30_09130 [Gillisia sp. M10.2A]|uniref:Tetratricopeptide repeat protein n=1 Tax=Gillisia lutea TaxID=2909668 RepID=A0ABS9EHM7_9FLAO|nr:hypothetical protein [Gillisia lutea]MCF4101827.1 hypothetical protein [Gillisia lutea]